MLFLHVFSIHLYICHSCSDSECPNSLSDLLEAIIFEGLEYNKVISQTRRRVVPSGSGCPRVLYLWDSAGAFALSTGFRHVFRPCLMLLSS